MQLHAHCYKAGRGRDLGGWGGWEMRGTWDTGHRTVWCQEGSEQLPRPHRASSQVFTMTTTISYSFWLIWKARLREMVKTYLASCYLDTCVLKLCSLCARGPLLNRKLKLSILSWLLLLPPSPAQHYLLPQECWRWMFLEEASLLFSVSFPTLLSSLPSRFSFINSFHKE